jgi:hypothetical protein
VWWSPSQLCPLRNEYVIAAWAHAEQGCWEVDIAFVDDASGTPNGPNVEAWYAEDGLRLHPPTLWTELPEGIARKRLAS